MNKVEIAHPDFTPFGLVKGPHTQTILSSFCPKFLNPRPQKSHHIMLEDGDTLVVKENRSEAWRAGDRIVLLVHGLCGCELSSYMIRMTRRLVGDGFLVMRLNLRGCGPGDGLARKTYHSGRSDDTRAVVRYIGEHFPGSPVTQIGVSLGANITLKMAGEMDSMAPCDSVGAISPPVDLSLCADRIAQAKGKVYDRYFVKKLMEHVRRIEGHFPDMTVTEFPKKMTLRLFDELYTAPHNGFKNAEDYYQQSSCGQFIPEIKAKGFILLSKDDPIVDYRPLMDIRTPAQLDIRLTDRGGHGAFLGPALNSRMFWMDSFVTQWIRSNLI